MVDAPVSAPDGEAVPVDVARVRVAFLPDGTAINTSDRSTVAPFLIVEGRLFRYERRYRRMHSVGYRMGAHPDGDPTHALLTEVQAERYDGVL